MIDTLFSKLQGELLNKDPNSNTLPQVSLTTSKGNNRRKYADGIRTDVDQLETRLVLSPCSIASIQATTAIADTEIISKDNSLDGSDEIISLSKEEKLAEVKSEEEIPNFPIPTNEIDTFFNNFDSLENVEFERNEQERKIVNSTNEKEKIDSIFEENDWKSYLNLDDDNSIFSSLEIDLNNPVLENNKDKLLENEEIMPQDENPNESDKNNSGIDVKPIEKQEDTIEEVPKEKPNKGFKAFFRKITGFWS